MIHRDSCQGNIKCSVKSCEFHDTKDLCSAEEIHVGEVNALSSKETRCDTFRAKDSYSS